MESDSRSVGFDSLQPRGLYGPWDSGQNTGVGSLSLLEQAVPTWELNQGLLLCRRILAGDPRSISGSGRYRGERKDSSILAWRIPWTVYGVAKSWARLSDFHFPLSLVISAYPPGKESKKAQKH